MCLFKLERWLNVAPQCEHGSDTAARFAGGGDEEVPADDLEAEAEPTCVPDDDAASGAAVGARGGGGGGGGAVAGANCGGSG